MKRLLIYTILTIAIFSCSSKEKFALNAKKCEGHRYRCDTIYYYFKNTKNEVKKIYLTDSINNRIQTVYWMRFKKSNKYFNVQKNSHYKRKGILYKYERIEKDKSFLRKKKNNIFTYKDFKNLSEIEMNKFYYGNKFSTFYLIDKTENKNGKIYLKPIRLGGNFPRVQ